jgi:hypothetical protein
MQDNNQDQSKALKQALEDSLSRGQAFEETIRTKGWELIQKYYQAKIQQFASSLLIEGSKPISDFESERRELIGLRKLLGMVDNDIKTLHDEHDKKVRGTPKE